MNPSLPLGGGGAPPLGRGTPSQLTGRERPRPCSIGAGDGGGVTCLCGRSFARGALFCRSCGKGRPSVEKSPRGAGAAAAPAARALCPTCGVAFLPGALFCHCCGARRRPDTAQPLSTLQPPASPPALTLREQAARAEAAATLVTVFQRSAARAAEVERRAELATEHLLALAQEQESLRAENFALQEAIARARALTAGLGLGDGSLGTTKRAPLQLPTDAADLERVTESARQLACLIVPVAVPPPVRAAVARGEALADF